MERGDGEGRWRGEGVNKQFATCSASALAMFKPVAAAIRRWIIATNGESSSVSQVFSLQCLIRRIKKGK
jgi:hypothetical protein